MKTILKSKIEAFYQVTKILPQGHRAVLERAKRDYIVVEQQINGEWFSCGRWEISALSEKPNGVYLDFGQGWWVNGMAEVVKEAEEIIASEITVS